MPILGFGAILFLAPSGRAQESNPQIFDNYEAGPAPVKAKNRTVPSKPVAGQVSTALRTKEMSKTTLRPAAERKSQNAQPRSTTAVATIHDSKRRKSDDQ